MQFLKADTNTEVLVGPVVAVGDGFTPVTTLSLSTADEAELIKYGGASALTVTDISGSTMSAITGADGYYTLDISTSNTDTEGFLTVLINDDSLCLPVRMDFMVVNANVYDSLFAAAATDYLQTDIKQIASTSILLKDLGILAIGTAQAATGTTLQLASAETFADDELNGAIVVITSASTGAGQSRQITDYASSTDTATVDTWTTTPTGTITYAVLAAPPASSTSLPPVNVTQLGGDAQSLTDLKDFADAGYDPATNKVQGVVLTDTLTTYTGNTVQTGDAYARLGAPAGASVSADIAALNDVSVADILTTAMTESYAADGATMTVAQALYLIAQTIGEFSVSGTTLTVKQLDGTTTAATYTLDSASAPTSRTRAT